MTCDNRDKAEAIVRMYPGICAGRVARMIGVCRDTVLCLLASSTGICEDDDGRLYSTDYAWAEYERGTSR